MPHAFAPILRRLSTALIAAGVTLGCLELTGRMLPPAQSPGPGFLADPELGWTLPVSTSYLWQDKLVTTNSLGLRSDELRDAEVTLLTVGDSSVFGDKVGQSETFSALLDARLAPDAHVQNGGVPGFTCPQASRLVERLRPVYSPDLTILYLMNSDFRAAEDGDVIALSVGPLGDLGIGRLARHATLTLRTRNARPGSELAIYRDCLAAMIQEQASHGDTLLVVPITGLDFGDGGGEHKRRLGTYRDAMRELAEATGSPLVDLPALFRASGLSADEALLDDVHPSATGHAFIADALLDTLRSTEHWP